MRLSLALLFAGSLSASTIYNLSILPITNNTTCQGPNIATTANSETLSLTGCQGPLGSVPNQPYVTGNASPLSVSIDGSVIFPATGGQVEFSGTVAFQGVLAALGGDGGAFLSFTLAESGSDLGYGTFQGAGQYINLSDLQTKKMFLPIQFGQSIPYTIIVGNSDYTGESDGYPQASMRIYDLQVVNYTGQPIPGAWVDAMDGTMVLQTESLASPRAVPEPEGLILGGLGLLVGLVRLRYGR